MTVTEAEPLVVGIKLVEPAIPAVIVGKEVLIGAAPTFKTCVVVAEGKAVGVTVGEADGVAVIYAEGADAEGAAPPPPHPTIRHKKTGAKTRISLRVTKTPR